MLVEVIISALLVGLIVVATMTGFDVVNRSSADQRLHAQAALLAAQSQEQLRSDPASALIALEGLSRSYARTLNGTTYTITQEAKALGSSGGSSSCSVAETSSQTANILIASSVTWPQLRKRPGVKVSSVVTPPIGSALEVDVGNGGSPPSGVSGVTVLVKYTAVGSSSTNTLEATTGPAGCVVFAGIPATSAIVEIPEKAGFVTPSGGLKVPNKELSIVPNLTTHDAVTYAEGGRLTGEFTYKGATTYEREAGKLETVRSDTFAALNSKMNTAPNFEVGATGFEYEVGGEEHFKTLTGTFAGGYAATATSTEKPIKAPGGDLFPFPAGWSVNAGDCPKNSLESATEKTEKLKNTSVTVEPGKAATVKVPLSYVLLSVRKGVYPKLEPLESAQYLVTITDAECQSEAAPNNAVAANLRHTQRTTAEGHLEVPFQPFGKYELCLYNESTKRADRVTYINSTVAGSALTIYPAEPSQAERAAEEAVVKSSRVAKEGEARTKRESEEATTKSNREKEEATAREKREKEEAKARETWKAEEKAKTITKKQREAKEREQRTARETAEAAESKKRGEAEAAENTKRGGAEAAETKKREEAEKPEKEQAAASEKLEKERLEKGYVVESGGSC